MVEKFLKAIGQVVRCLAYGKDFKRGTLSWVIMAEDLNGRLRKICFMPVGNYYHYRQQFIFIQGQYLEEMFHVSIL